MSAASAEKTGTPDPVGLSGHGGWPVTPATLIPIAGMTCAAGLLNATGAVFIIQIYRSIIPANALNGLVILTLSAFALYGVQAMLRIMANARAENLGLQLLDHYERVPHFDLQDIQNVARALRSRAVLSAFDMLWAPVFIGLLAWIDLRMGAFAIAMLILLALAHHISRPDNENTTLDAVPKRRRGDFGHAGAGQTGSWNVAVATSDALRHMIAMRRVHERQSEQLRRRQERIHRHLLPIIREYAHSGILALGAWLVITGRLDVGALIASGMIMIRIFGPFLRFMEEYPGLRKAWESWKALGNAHARNEETTRPGRNHTNRLQILISGSLETPGTSAFRLDIRSGDIIVIHGPSGSGKSSLLRSLLNANGASGYTMNWHSHDMAGISTPSLSRHAGYMPQEHAFLPSILLETIRRFDQKIDRKACIEACKAVGLHQSILAMPDQYRTRLGPGAPELSFQKLRLLALARAIASKPPILVLDDPCLGLDSANRATAIRCLSDEAREGAIIIMTCPEPPPEFLSARCIMLKEGCIPGKI